MRLNSTCVVPWTAAESPLMTVTLFAVYHTQPPACTSYNEQRELIVLPS